MMAEKVVLVTGGTSGIGLAVVRRMLADGAKVAFCARRADSVRDVSRSLSEEFGDGRVLGRAVDVRDPDGFSAFAEEVESGFGGCDALVTNAGQGHLSSFAETSDQDWRDEFELKLFSQIHPIRACQDMLSRSTGAIVAVNSLLAYQPEPHMVCTSSVRAAVQNLLKSLSVELAPHVRVNSIVLGLVDSGQWQRRFEARSDQRQSREAYFADLATQKSIPLGRLGKPEEAANAIAFLASPSASYITGAQIEVSGGLSRHI